MVLNLRGSIVTPDNKWTGNSTTMEFTEGERQSGILTTVIDV